ncbi:YopX family protein [Fusobacterium polymorphum]|uniref:YopX family protein n=1 Tax=Fusobacterium nucleatum subsp. polymorphum TaxID=76857 RepID=UPI00300A394E
MREIKFRAWLKEEKIIGEVLGIDILHKEIFFSNEDVDCYEHIDFKDIELMQYTGLKDKNNKEVYEGDIVKLRANHGIGVIKYYDEWGAFVVEYIKPRPLTVLGMNYYKEDIEILGNIYENPELIKEWD